MISIKQLRYFDALARIGHFGRAAESCAITQPALSMQIQELERDLGIQLIERRRGGVTLSQAGQSIADRAASILLELQNMEDFARAQQGVLRGKLSLGIIPTIAPYLLPSLLELASEHFPELELDVRESQTHRLIDLLLEGSLDLLLLALPVEAADIETMPLFEDRFLLAVAGDQGAQSNGATTLERLHQNRLLLLEEGHCLRDQALQFCDRNQFSAVDAFGTSSLATIVQLVASGMGATLLPEISVPFEAKDNALSLYAFEDPQPARTIGLAWRATSPLGENYRKLGHTVVEAAKGVLETAQARI